MTRKYSLAQLTVLSWTPPEMIYNAHVLGYDYVGVRSISMGVSGEHNFNLNKNTKLFDLTRQAMEETGTAIHDIELAKIADGIDVKNYESAFEVAQRLGVKHVISSIWTDKEDFYLDQFATLCDLAGGYDITVDLEFVTWASVRDLKGAREVLQAVDRPNAGLMIDTLHFNRSRVSIEELKDCPPKLFHMAHICDGPKEIPTDTAGLIHTGRDARLYCGEGAIDIAAIVAALPKETVLSVELPHLERVSNFGGLEHARRCLTTAKAYMKDRGIA